MTAPRVILDTNVLVSALIFRPGPPAALRPGWLDERILPLFSRETVDELVRVLQYPKFDLMPDEQDELLAEILPYSEIVRIPRRLSGIPKCRDPNDAMFLRLAAAGRAEYLVTGDRDVLTLKGTFRIPIVTPKELLASLD